MKDLYELTLPFDTFNLISKDGFEVSKGEIIGKDNGKIHVCLKNVIAWHEDQLYDIVFQRNRTPFLLQHKALEYVHSHQLFDVLINNPKYWLNQSENSPSKPVSCDQNDLNEEQEVAVENIVAGDYYPLPYLLYGPPGTGKTKALIASIVEIVEKDRGNVLVCTQSNAACDEMLNRLSTFLDESEMFRLYSTSKDVDGIKPSVLQFSNFFEGELKYPSLRYIYRYRVVICTLATAGCLTRANCKHDHFDYVFIDECASALEAMALVPIAGLCTTFGQVHSKIVLAGDPKQLDAVTKSEWAAKLGYGTSLLEHLFNFPLYKRDAISGQYNSKYITQLVKNYRSHPAILYISNKLFYEGALTAETAPQIDDLKIKLPQLNPDFPIIFKSIQGICVKPEDDTR